MIAGTETGRRAARLLRSWLTAGRVEVEEYLSNNGAGPVDPAQVAATCQSLKNIPDGALVAAWHLRQIRRTEEGA